MTQQIYWALQTTMVRWDQMAAVRTHVEACGATVVECIIDHDAKTLAVCNEPASKLVIPYGSVRLCLLTGDKGWTGRFFNNNFSTTIWNEQHPEMLNDVMVTLPLANVNTWLQACGYANTDKLFVRPEQYGKAFSGKVVTVDALKRWDDGGLPQRFDTYCNCSTTRNSNRVALVHRSGTNC